MDFVCIDRLEGDGLITRTMAVWCDGKFEDNVAYALQDAPSGELAGKTDVCFPKKYQQLSPVIRCSKYAGRKLCGCDAL